MLLEVEIEGVTPLLMHCGFKGLDIGNPCRIEISKIIREIRGKERTVDHENHLRRLECQMSIWTDEKNKPTVPAQAIRTCIENGAKKLRHGSKVREGLIIRSIDEFIYDHSLGETDEELAANPAVHHVAPVVVQRARVLRTRAQFKQWGLRFTLWADNDVVMDPTVDYSAPATWNEQSELAQWLEIAGSRVGLGDWRPQKSGTFGRFEVISVSKKK